jgi:hypothetical protein
MVGIGITLIVFNPMAAHANGYLVSIFSKPIRKSIAALRHTEEVIKVAATIIDLSFNDVM